jgi:GntR family transcriptional regulator, transcriptional repressor for pyruvate dehydrogenase complex
LAPVSFWEREIQLVGIVDPMAGHHGDTLHPLLSPVGGAGLAEAVTTRVREAIGLGLLAPGQQLPSEAALAARFGVSTVTLREALATLRQEGLVETRRGRHGGSFVVGPITAPEVALLDRLRSLTVTSLRDMGDEQAAVASTTARLAAARSSDTNLVHLVRFAEQLQRAVSRPERARAHSRFHIEMAIASQSERLTRAQLRLQGEAGELLWVSTQAPRSQVDAADALHRIAMAIEEEDAESARTLAERLAEANTRWLIDAHLELMDA